MASHSDTQITAQGMQPRAALVVSHPGHELRVHGWLEATRPSVCVITDGSGRTGSSRLGSTTSVLEACGARLGPVYGGMTDGDFYAAVLDHEHSTFVRLVEQLASLLIRERVEIVAGDADEGYNPAHDICRLVINSAVTLVGRTTPLRIYNYDFTLVAPPDHCPANLLPDAIRLELDEEAFARKLSAARDYTELREEVEAALSGAGSVALRDNADLSPPVKSNFGGAEQFRVECLRPVVVNESAANVTRERPFYEGYGEKQVQAGHYQRVLRYGEHVLPLALALDAHVENLS